MVLGAFSLAYGKVSLCSNTGEIGVGEGVQLDLEKSELKLGISL